MTCSRVLITGNLGYIGPILQEYLAKKGVKEIVGLDIGYFQNCTLDHAPIDWFLSAQYYVDLRDVTRELLEGFDAVVHLAGVSNDPMGKEFEDATYQINLDASIRLAEMAAEAGVKNFVFASSCSVYGAAGDAMRKEDDELNPLTAYAISKIEFEKKLDELSGKYPAMVSTALRFSTACGPSPRVRLDLVLNDFVITAMTTGTIEILSDGTPLRPLVDVEDMARAIFWACIRKEENGGRFLAVNIGRNDNNHSVLELAEFVQAELPGTNINVNSNAAPDKRSYAVNFDLFAQLAPEFQPVHTVSSSVRRLIDLFSGYEDKFENFRNSYFIRHNMLRELKKNGQIDALLRLQMS